MAEKTETVNEAQNGDQPPAATIDGIKSLKGTFPRHPQLCEH
jgi:hypothetical protein